MLIIAKAIIFDRDNRILVLERSQTHPRFANHLDFPGGIVENGELANEAVVREICEESGMQIRLDAMDLVYSQQMSDDLLYMIFSTKVTEQRPNITLSWEHVSFQWLSYGELLSKVIPVKVDWYYSTVLKYLASR